MRSPARVPSERRRCTRTCTLAARAGKFSAHWEYQFLFDENTVPVLGTNNDKQVPCTATSTVGEPPPTGTDKQSTCCARNEVGACAMWEPALPQVPLPSKWQMGSFLRFDSAPILLGSGELFFSWGFSALIDAQLRRSTNETTRPAL